MACEACERRRAWIKKWALIAKERAKSLAAKSEKKAGC